LIVSFAGLVVGMRCAEAVAGERERQTWDLLQLTGLDPHLMLWSKIRGIVESSYPFLVAYALPALAGAALGGVLSFLSTLFLVGIAWPVMYFLGAVALERSTLHASTRRSIPHGFVSGFGLLCMVMYPFVYGGVMVVMFLLGSTANKDSLSATVTSFLSGLAGLLVVGGLFSAVLVRIASNYVRDAAVNLIRQQKGFDKEVIR
jgi:hypothetical protein